MENYSKTLVVGDIHGKLDYLKKVLGYSGPIVFVGDFVDSHDKKTIQDQVECIALVLDLVENSDGRVVSLIGNHEASYLWPEQQCSGWTKAMSAHMITIRERILKSFLRMYTTEGYLISHAGITEKDLNRDWNNDYWYFKVGEDSGGQKLGGPLWLRPSEVYNNDTAYAPNQIFGHTPHKGVMHYGNNAYCIDNLDRNTQCVLIKDGVRETISLTTL